jgi:hypothetical protein
MTCIEMQESLAENEFATTAEQWTHLKNCPECSALVREFNLIIASASELRGADEPSPRVWNSIQIALRQEGLIRSPRGNRPLLPSFASSGLVRWLAPVAAVLLVTAGVYMYERPSSQQLASNNDPPAVSGLASDASIAGLNDADLLQEAAQQTPAMKAQYEDDLRRVNQYIQDAREVVAADPNDEEARRSLLEAYQQKAMLFDLAMDRSLP